MHTSTRHLAIAVLSAGMVFVPGVAAAGPGGGHHGGGGGGGSHAYSSGGHGGGGAASYGARGHGAYTYGRGYGYAHGYPRGFPRFVGPGLFIGGFALGALYAPWYGYYDYPYYGGPAYYDSVAADAPAVIEAPATAASPPARVEYRFYCTSSNAYYPDVPTCATPWLKVVN